MSTYKKHPVAWLMFLVCLTYLSFKLDFLVALVIEAMILSIIVIGDCMGKHD